MERALGLFLVMVLSSCAPGQLVTWDRLADDETVWARCQRLVAEHHCGRLTPTTNMHGRAACVLNFMNEFRAQTTWQTQRAWLLANGCPAPLVSPEQVLVFEYDEAWHAAHRSEGEPSRPVAPAPRPPTPTPPVAASVRRSAGVDGIPADVVAARP